MSARGLVLALTLVGWAVTVSGVAAHAMLQRSDSTLKRPPDDVRLYFSERLEPAYSSLRVLVVDAYPTTYKRPAATYHASSIASGMAIYGEHCAGCHGPTGAGVPHADLRATATSRRHAGELFWLIGRGVPERGMPAHDGRLAESRRWDVINVIRALAAAGGATAIGREVEGDRAWLAAPDFTVAIGPLAPTALRDHRGRRMVLLVLYTLPGSLSRMRELARTYDVLAILGVEVVAVSTPASPARDPRARRVPARAVRGRDRRERRHRGDVRPVRARPARRDADRSAGIHPRDLDSGRRAGPTIHAPGHVARRPAAGRGGGVVNAACGTRAGALTAERSTATFPARFIPRLEEAA